MYQHFNKSILSKIFFLTLFVCGEFSFAQGDLAFMDLTSSLINLSESENNQKLGYYARKGALNTYIVHSEKPCYLWIEDQLIKKVEACDTLHLNELTKYSKSKEVLLVFSGNNFRSNFQFGRELKNTKPVIVDDYVIRERTQTLNGRKNFMLFGSIVVLLLLGILLFLYRERILFIFSKIFNIRHNSPNENFFSVSSISILVFLSVTMSFVCICLFYENFTFERYLLGWGKWMVFIFGVLILKKHFIYLFSNLFQLSNQKNGQLFDLVNFSFITFLGMFFLITLDYILDIQLVAWLSKYFIVVLLIAYLLYAIWEINKIIYHSLKNKLLIIVYICATELVPTLIFVKLVQ